MTAVAAGPLEQPGADATPRPGTRMRWTSTITSAFVVTLVRPASWAFGLLGFLAGGGLVIVAWPILVLPTPTGLQTALGGPVSTLVLGSSSVTLVLLVAAVTLAGFAVLVAGTWIGAWAERQGIATALDAAAEEGLIVPGADLSGAPGPGRITMLRLIGLGPVGVVLVAAWPPLYDAAYRELVLPNDLVTPLPLRVIGDLPWLVLAVVATWILSDAAAAVGVRRLVLERRGVLAAYALGWAELVRSPHRVLGTALVGVGVVVLLLGPALLAASIGWASVRGVGLESRDPVGMIAAVSIWIALWLGALVLAGVAAAIRSAAFTFVVPHR